MYEVTFAKARQKFAAAHFTLFDDGEAERLHGHNYRVSVVFRGHELQRGLLFPFHDLKALIDRQCAAWDERVLLPTRSDWVRLQDRDGQCEVRLQTSKTRKFYSFPGEDVVLLDCDNISCENLARLFAEALRDSAQKRAPNLTGMTVTIGESQGQSVGFQCVAGSYPPRADPQSRATKYQE